MQTPTNNSFQKERMISKEDNIARVEVTTQELGRKRF